MKTLPRTAASPAHKTPHTRRPKRRSRVPLALALEERVRREHDVEGSAPRRDVGLVLVERRARRGQVRRDVDAVGLLCLILVCFVDGKLRFGVWMSFRSEDAQARMKVHRQR